MIKFHSHRILYFATGTVLVFLLLVGCVHQDAWLSYTVPEIQKPTATAVHTISPTREPIAISIDPVFGGEFYTDRKGIPILDNNTHYFTYYLAFSDLRIYEENGFTYMDGICTNSFDGTLTGKAQICFYDKDEKLVGYGAVHTANGDLTLQVGRNRIYSEILSEVDVQQLECRIEQVSAFNPS